MRSLNLFFTIESNSEADIVIKAVSTPAKANEFGAGAATDLAIFERAVVRVA